MKRINFLGTIILLTAMSTLLWGGAYAKDAPKPSDESVPKQCLNVLNECWHGMNAIKKAGFLATAPAAVALCFPFSAPSVPACVEGALDAYCHVAVHHFKSDFFADCQGATAKAVYNWIKSKV